MNFKNCLDKKQIVLDSHTTKWADKEIDTGKRFLSSAKRLLEIQDNEMSEIAAYNAVFHFTRHLLFKKGYSEKSHFCLYLSVQDLYNNKELNKILTNITQIKSRRNDIQYGGLLTETQEVSYVIQTAEDILNWIKENTNK